MRNLLLASFLIGIMFVIQPLPAEANVLTNPGFETGDLNGWSAWSVETNSSVVNSPIHSGTYALREVLNNGSSEGGYLQNLIAIGMLPGDLINGSVWIKAESLTNEEAYLRIEFMDDNWAQTGPPLESARITGTVDWTKASVSGTIPAGTTKANFILKLSATGMVSGNVYFDEAYLDKAPSGSAIYPLDDFDDAAVPNDFYGNQGPWSNSNATVNAAFDSGIFYGENGASWKITYDVAKSGAEGGIYEQFTYNYLDEANPSYDLSRFNEFRFRIKGGPAPENFTTKFLIEFADKDWNKAIFEITGVTSGWKEYAITLGGGSVDWTQMRQFAVVLRKGHVDDLKGVLYFDDLGFVESNCGYANDDEFLTLMNKNALRYFLEAAHPTTGLCRDRAETRDVSSVAAVGFQLTGLSIGAERGWISRTEAADRVKAILTTLWQGPQGPETSGRTGYKGFFYHMLDIRTGLRDGTSELSVIDSALCLAGVVFVKEYFNGANQTEQDIRALADNIYNRVDWQWYYDSGANQFYLGWSPESGFYGHWDYYTDEASLICLLAIGSPTFPVNTDCFYGWTRQTGTYGSYSLIQTLPGPLFTYQFAQNWFDLRDKKDKHPTAPINWFDNSVSAARANQQFCVDNSWLYYTYSGISWGLTAGMSEVGYYVSGSKPCAIGNPDHNGTINVYGAGSAITFTPAESIGALKNYYENYPKFWGLYGLRDGYDLQSSSDPADDWYSHDYIGIDNGPMLVAIENYQSGLVWNTFMKNANVQNAVNKVFNVLTNPGFETGDLSGWSSWSVEANSSVVTSPVRTGTYALREVLNNGATEGGFIQNLITLGMSPGDPVGASVWIKAEALTNEDAYLRLEFMDDNWSQAGPALESNHIMGTTDWTKVSVSGTIPTGTTKANLILKLSSTGAVSGNVYFDEVYCR